MSDEKYEFIRPLFTNMGRFLKAHFAGGTWVVWVALGGFGAFQTLRVDWLGSRLDTVREERDTLLKESNNKGATINSQIKTAERRNNAQKERENVETKIINADNPVDALFQWMHNNEPNEPSNSD